MGKKKVVINRSKDLDDVDQELDVAMEMLDGANTKVVELLHSYVPEDDEESSDSIPEEGNEDSSEHTPDS